MMTLTFTLDDEAAAAAKLIAEQRHTTVEALVGDYVKTLARESDEERHRLAVGQLMSTLRKLSRPMGGKGWINRDELYD